MIAYLILAALWLTPGVLVLTWWQLDRYLARRAAARRLAAAEEAFWTSLTAFVDRARLDIDEERDLRLWNAEVEGA